jgi:hypothetical protein
LLAVRVSHAKATTRPAGQAKAASRWRCQRPRGETSPRQSRHVPFPRHRPRPPLHDHPSLFRAPNTSAFWHASKREVYHSNSALN